MNPDICYVELQKLEFAGPFKHNKLRDDNQRFKDLLVSIEKSTTEKDKNVFGGLEYGHNIVNGMERLRHQKHTKKKDFEVMYNTEPWMFIANMGENLMNGHIEQRNERIK